MRVNQHTVNIKKSKFTLIGSSARLSKVDSIVICTDRKPLEEVQSLSYLGIVINKNLMWDDHLYHIRGKIKK